MPHKDFDIDALAKYLHLTPPQVSRLADRGKLPGRKVSGSWRFSQAEIHHWLEERIVSSDDDELAQMEDVLQRNESATEETTPPIAAMLSVEAVAIPLNARTKNSVIHSMSQLAAGTGLLWDADKMAEAIRVRESLYPTAMENGVALLHPRRPMSNILAEPVLALGRTFQGIPFGGAHGRLTDIFFLICSTNDRGHLQTLARLSRLVSDDALLAAIRDADDSQTALQAIADAEIGLE